MHSVSIVLQKCGSSWLCVHSSSNVQAVPSCATMCSCTAVARGPRLVRYCASVAHSGACTHTHEEAHRFMDEHMYTPFAGSCRNHMFYKNPGEGEERAMTSSGISISAIKDTIALKVSRCAVNSSQIKNLVGSQKLY